MARPQKVRDLGPRLRGPALLLAPRGGTAKHAGSFLAIIAGVCASSSVDAGAGAGLRHRPAAGRGQAAALLGSLDPMTLLLVASIGTVVTVGLRALAAYYSTVGFALIEAGPDRRA